MRDMRPPSGIRQTFAIPFLVLLAALGASGCGGDDDPAPKRDTKVAIEDSEQLDEVAHLLVTELQAETLELMRASKADDGATIVAFTTPELQDLADDALDGSDYEGLDVEFIQKNVSFEESSMTAIGTGDDIDCADAIDGERGGVAVNIIPTGFGTQSEAHYSVVTLQVYGDDDVVFAADHSGDGGGYVSQRRPCPEDPVGSGTVGYGDVEDAEYTVPEEWQTTADELLAIYQAARGDGPNPPIPAAQLEQVAGLAKLQQRLDAAAKAQSIEVTSVCAKRYEDRPTCDALDGAGFVSILDETTKDPYLQFGIWKPEDSVAVGYVVNPALFDAAVVEDDGWPEFSFSTERADYNAFSLGSRACDPA